MRVQEARPGDKAALNAQCEPLLTVAEAHADGKESFARSIATELFSDFLSVEERFAANKEATEQEVIDSLRQVGTAIACSGFRAALRGLMCSAHCPEDVCPAGLIDFSVHARSSHPGPQALVTFSGAGDAGPDIGTASM